MPVGNSLIILHLWPILLALALVLRSSYAAKLL